MATSLRARVVYPVDRPAIEHGAVTIDGARIVSVGTEVTGATVVDLGNVAILPGLVNAHTHLEFSHLQRPLGRAGMPLADWIRLVIDERGHGGDAPDDAISAGLRESFGYGATTIGDIAAGDVAAYSSHFGGTDNPVGQTIDGQDSPSHDAAEVTAFVEVIGFSQARAESAFAAVGGRLAELERIGSVRPGLSPHAPYTVSPDLLSRLVQLACERELPMAMHLAESADELELLRDGTGRLQELLVERSMWDADAIPSGSHPLDYLRLLAAAPRSILIHGNYLDHEEHMFLAAHADRMSLIYCPRTHAYFAHPPYPLASLLAAGVNVALGTDSRASNPDLDLLGEMRHAAAMHPEIEPHDILRMGTLAGAEALGRADEVGSITPGKLANLVAIPLPEDAAKSSADLLAALLADHAVPCAVWLRGRKL